MASLYAMTIGQDIELKRVLADAGMDLEMAEAIFKSPRNALARNVVELLKEQMGSNMLFVSPDQQITNLRQWMDFGHLQGFTEADFDSVLEAKGKLPNPVGLTVPVLVPYLGKVGDTFDALWDVVESVYDEHWRNPGLKSDKRHLRLLEGIEHPGKCLRWEIIDLGAHHEPKNGREVRNVRGAGSAHAGVLAALAHFPKWVEAMDGETVPYVDIAGYEACVDGYDPWRFVPYVDRDGAEVELDVYWDGYSRRAMPLLASRE
jgi:hypothetical protein